MSSLSKLSRKWSSDKRRSDDSSYSPRLMSLRSHTKLPSCFCMMELEAFDDAVKERLRGRFCDAHLRPTDCESDNEAVGIHRIFLCACSPVFNELLNDRFVTVQVGMTTDTLNKVLDAAYSGACKVTENTLNSLMEAGHNYQIHIVQKLCHDFIQAKAGSCSRNLPQLLHYYRLSRAFLCTHMTDKLRKTIQHNFGHFASRPLRARSGQSDSQADAEIFSPNAEELMSIIGDDELSVKEEHLLQYLLDWWKHKTATSCSSHLDEDDDPMGNAEVTVDDLTMKELLENVRFGLYSRKDLEALLRRRELQIFLPGAQYEVETLQLALGRGSVTTKGNRYGRSLAPGRRQSRMPHATPSSSSSSSNSLGSNITAAAVLDRPRVPREVIVVMGGWAAFPHGPTDKVESYNWLAKQWTNLGISLPDNRAYHGLVKLDRKVYLIGGYDGLGPTYHNSLHRLDLDTRTWTEMSCMDTRRCYVGSVALGSRLVAVGGHDGKERHKTVEMYDTATNQWDFLPDMHSKRSDFAVVNFQDKIVVIGGFTGEEVLNSIEMYDPLSESWEFLSPLTIPRSGVSAIVMDNKIYVLGGFNGTERLKSVECFTPGVTRSIWHEVPDMLTPRSNFTVTVIQGKIVVIGGYVDPSVSAMCEIYCPKSKSWSQLPNMNLERSALNQVTITWDDTDNLPALLKR